MNIDFILKKWKYAFKQHGHTPEIRRNRPQGTHVLSSRPRDPAKGVQNLVAPEEGGLQPDAAFFRGKTQDILLLHALHVLPYDVEPDFCMVEHGESEKHAEVFLTEHLFFISKINFQNESFLYIQPRFL